MAGKIRPYMDEHPQLLAMYREVNALELREVATRLRELFLINELAYMANTSTGTMRNLLGASAEHAHSEEAGKLRAALTCVLILQQEERVSVIRNWFTNINPYLDFRAPSQVIREGGLREAIKAARAFAEYTGGIVRPYCGADISVDSVKVRVTRVRFNRIATQSTKCVPNAGTP